MDNDRPLDGVRAVVFDFDGTLADSYDAIAASVNHVRAFHGKPPLPVAEVKRHVGRGPEYLLEHTVGNGDVQADLDRYRTHHPTVMAANTRLLPGAADALAAIKRTHWRAAICSNKPRNFTKELLHVLGINELVEVVLGPEDVARPKPAPDMLVLALTRLDLRPEEALYVGDMVVDIQAGRAAGLRVWTVATGSDTLATLSQAKPDRLLRDLAELAELLGGK